MRPRAEIRTTRSPHLLCDPVIFGQVHCQHRARWVLRPKQCSVNCAWRKIWAHPWRLSELSFGYTDTVGMFYREQLIHLCEQDILSFHSRPALEKEVLWEKRHYLRYRYRTKQHTLSVVDPNTVHWIWIRIQDFGPIWIWFRIRIQGYAINFKEKEKNYLEENNLLYKSIFF